MCLKLVKGKQCKGKNIEGTSFCTKHQLRGPFDIEKLTLENEEKGPVIIYTDMPGVGGRIQIALMSLKKGEDIPMEEHEYVTQFVKVEKGKGRVVID
jgi:quercetin dioxygenase-like cupin family protein